MKKNKLGYEVLFGVLALVIGLGACPTEASGGGIGYAGGGPASRVCQTPLPC